MQRLLLYLFFVCYSAQIALAVRSAPVTNVSPVTEVISGPEIYPEYEYYPDNDDYYPTGPETKYPYDEYTLTSITPPDAVLLTNPQWSTQENVLYYCDKFGQKLYRLDPSTDDRTVRDLDYGPTGVILPVQDNPGVVMVAMRTGVYILKWGAPGGDTALRQLTNVDLGKPDNIICVGKVDVTGRLWFGTVGRLIGIDAVPDEGTVYSMSDSNIEDPDVKIRPVSISMGITFSNDNKRMFFNDGPTRQVVGYDFVPETGEIANKTVVYDFDDYGMPGIPYGITTDVDDNLWVATFNGSRILKIDPKSGYLLYQITLPVDQVNAMIWGGKDFSTLYIGTGRFKVDSPKPLSGCLFTLTNTGTKGKPEPTFILPNAEEYYEFS